MRLLRIAACCTLILPFVAMPASANTYLGTAIFTCTDFTAAGNGADILDRDNTGLGEETDRIDVFDGGHTLLFTFTFTNALGTYSGGLIPTEAFTTPPLANPLTMTVTSLAGNGLPEEVDVRQSGLCPGLRDWVGIPTLSRTGVLALGALLAVSALLLLRKFRQAN